MEVCTWHPRANANATADSGHDSNPDVAVSSCGTVFVAWSTADDLGYTTQTDSVVVFSRLGDLEGIFCDGFEYGSTLTW